MSDEQQPELRWAPIPPKPKNRARIWLIVGLVIAAAAIVGVLLFFLLPRGASPDPSGTPTPSETGAPSPSSSPSESIPPTDDPSMPVSSEPPVADPSLDAFTARVSGWLEDGGRGLDMLSGLSASDTMPVIDTLQEDAQRLSDTQAPSSIDVAWREGVATYGKRLAELRTATENNSGQPAAIASARAALTALTDLVGL